MKPICTRLSFSFQCADGIAVTYRDSAISASCSCHQACRLPRCLAITDLRVFLLKLQDKITSFSPKSLLVTVFKQSHVTCLTHRPRHPRHTSEKRCLLCFTRFTYSNSPPPLNSDPDGILLIFTTKASVRTPALPPVTS